MGSVPYLALGDPPKYSGDEKRHTGFGIGFSKRRETVKSLMDLMDAAMYGIKHCELCSTLTNSPVSHAHVVLREAATSSKTAAYFDQIPGPFG